MRNWEDSSLVLNEKEAVLIRRILAFLLERYSPCKIAKTLTAQSILSRGKKQKWNTGTLKRTLQNEERKGNALLQKKATQLISSLRKRKLIKVRLPNTVLKTTTRQLSTLLYSIWFR
jgi:hypothetical protein